MSSIEGRFILSIRGLKLDLGRECFFIDYEILKWVYRGGAAPLDPYGHIYPERHGMHRISIPDMGEFEVHAKQFQKMVKGKGPQSLRIYEVARPKGD